MQFIQTMKIILSLLPLIIQAVQAIEQAMPQSGQGAAKLEAIRQMLQSAYSVSTDAMGPFEQIWPALSSTVSAVVGLFNSAGAFKKA